MDGFSARRIASKKNVEVCEIALLEASVKICYFFSRGFGAFPLLVTSMITLHWISMCTECIVSWTRVKGRLLTELHCVERGHVAAQALHNEGSHCVPDVTTKSSGIWFW